MTAENNARAALYAQRLQQLGVAADVSVEDQCVVLDFDQLDILLSRVQEMDRRTRKRDVLVAQALMLLRTSGVQHPVLQNDTYLENLAERLIDTLGTAVLVEGERKDTSYIPTGEHERMTRAEFEARQTGTRPPVR